MTLQRKKIKSKDADKMLGGETKLVAKGPRRLSAVSTNLSLLSFG
jgi:hypothetical protein